MKAWKGPYAELEAMGYEKVASWGGVDILATGEYYSWFYIVTPIDWPMMQAFRVRGSWRARPHSLLGLRGWHRVVVRDPSTLKPKGEASVRPSQAGFLVVEGGNLGPWDFLDPYPQDPGGEGAPPTYYAIDYIRRHRPALVYAVWLRTSIHSAGPLRARIPPGPIMALGVCDGVLSRIDSILLKVLKGRARIGCLREASTEGSPPGSRLVLDDSSGLRPES